MTLIELLVYLALSSIVLMGGTTILFTVYQSAGDLSRCTDELIQLACALTTLSRDISQQASGALKLGKDRIMFSHRGSFCIWWVAQGRLMRGYGTYDPASEKIICRTSSLIARSVRFFECTPVVVNRRVRGISCILKSTHHQLTSIMSVGDNLVGDNDE